VDGKALEDNGRQTESNQITIRPRGFIVVAARLLLLLDIISCSTFLYNSFPTNKQAAKVQVIVHSLPLALLQVAIKRNEPKLDSIAS